MEIKVGFTLEREVLLEFVGRGSKVFDMDVFIPCIPCSPSQITDIWRKACHNVVYNCGIPIIKSGGQARTQAKKHKCAPR